MQKSTPRLLSFLTILALLLLVVSVVFVLVFTPTEITMGAVQKVFYFHVSAAWAGALAFVTAAVVSLAYLRTHKSKWDAASVASVEIGMVLMLIAIISGSIWARPTWNTWWTWDPRLTTVTVMELIYAAYFLLRQGIEDPERRGRFAAIYAIIGFISVPFMFVSIRIFRTIHPVIIGAGDPSGSTFSMSPPMVLAFALSLLTFTLIFFALLWHRVRLELLKRTLDELKSQEN